MIGLLSWLTNSLLPLATFFLTSLVVLFILNKVRILVYNSAMDYFVVMEKRESLENHNELLEGLQQQHRALLELSGSVEERKNKLLLDIGIIEKHKNDVEVE